MALSVLRTTFSSNTHVQSSCGARCLILVGPFVYFHISCVRKMKALARLRGCAGSLEPSLVAYAISTIISWAGSNLEPSAIRCRARCLILVGPFVYFHTSCVRTAKALASLRGCAGSPEPSLVAYPISTIISWAGSNLEPSASSAITLNFSKIKPNLHIWRVHIWGVYS